MTRRPSNPAPALALCAVSTIGAALLARAAQDTTGRGPTDPATVLVAASAWVAAVLAGWLAISAGLHLAAALPGRLGAACDRVCEVVTPALVRQVVALGVGTSAATTTLAGAPVAAASPSVQAPPDPGMTGTEDPRVTPPSGGPGSATSAPSPSWPTTPSPAMHRVEVDPTLAPAPGWTPSRPRPVRQASLDVLGPGTTAPVDDTQVVVRGDCLWDVVRRHLGPRATDAEIAAQIPAWHATNAAVIGPDPDVIQPGSTLRPPQQEDR